MVRLHPSEFLGGDGCKTIGQEFDGEFDLFEQGVQLAEKIKRCNKWIVGWNFFEQLILEYLSNSINIFFTRKMKFPFLMIQIIKKR